MINIESYSWRDSPLEMVGFMFQKVGMVRANITHHNMPLKK